MTVRALLRGALENIGPETETDAAGKDVILTALSAMDRVDIRWANGMAGTPSVTDYSRGIVNALKNQYGVR